MEIIAESISDAGNFFLHAGYGSATGPNPHSFSPETAKTLFNQHKPVITLDMTEALRLKGEVIGKSEPDTMGSAIKSTMTALGSDMIPLTLGLLCFFAGLSMIYRVKHHLPARPLALRKAVLAVLLTSLAVVAGGLGTLRTNRQADKPPWEGISLRDYAHPADATRAILYGIIADAAVNSGRPIYSLADLRGQVGLPARRLTQGQRYALATYGLDGWGRPFRLDPIPMRLILAKPGETTVTVSMYNDYEYVKGYERKQYIPSHYTITSVGQDGISHTADDIRLDLMPDQTRASKWEDQLWSYYVQHVGAEAQLFIHRYHDSEYQARHGWRAQKLTGSFLFDVVEMSSTEFDKTYAALASGLPYHPLVLVLFRNPENGALEERNNPS